LLALSAAVAPFAAGGAEPAVQSDGVSAAAAPDSAMVGDVISLNITLKIPKGARVIPPESAKGFGDFTVFGWNDETVSGGGGDTAKYQYNIATYKPVNCTIPPLTFLVGDDAHYDTLVTGAIPIKMISAIPPESDSVITIKDLKAQQRTGGADIRYLWLLLIAALIFLAYYLIEKYVRKRHALDPGTVVVKPPYEEAIDAIGELENKKYLERGIVREYAFELSEIFKRYIGRRYDTIASELTTEEIVAWLEYSGISVDMRLCAERFFRSSDQVKFAKWKPDQQTIDSFMKDVRTFLEATKPNPELQYEQKTERMGAAT
jgi:hypothetical protein